MHAFENSFLWSEMNLSMDIMNWNSLQNQNSLYVRTDTFNFAAVVFGSHTMWRIKNLASWWNDSSWPRASTHKLLAQLSSYMLVQTPPTNPPSAAHLCVGRGAASVITANSEVMLNCALRWPVVESRDMNDKCDGMPLLASGGEEWLGHPPLLWPHVNATEHWYD